MRYIYECSAEIDINNFHIAQTRELLGQLNLDHNMKCNSVGLINANWAEMMQIEAEKQRNGANASWKSPKIALK